jgi:hypothetical protein
MLLKVVVPMGGKVAIPLTDKLVHKEVPGLLPKPVHN